MKKILSICIFTLSFSAHAEQIATVLVALNKVTAESGNAQRTLTRGSPIYLGDAIVTTGDSQVQIKYTNGTVVNIQSNSKYKTLAYDPQKSDGFKADLSVGTINYASAGGKKQGTIQTPVVALGIQGTKFEAQASCFFTYVNVAEGVVEADGRRLGPQEPFQKGAFDQNHKFTACTPPKSY